MIKLIITIICLLAYTLTAIAEKETEPSPVVATRKINTLLETKKFEEIYSKWCHPHFQKQLNKEKFLELMKGQFGRNTVKVFSEVIKAIDAKAGSDVLTAGYQESQNEYEFSLTQARKVSFRGASNSPWHIELKLHDGIWKLKDID